jgi:uncharacterized protein YjgD (DUF1641 family)
MLETLDLTNARSRELSFHFVSAIFLFVVEYITANQSYCEGEINLTFSQRNGYSNIRTQLQLDQIDGPLKNSIWNVLTSCFWPKISIATYPSSNGALHALMLNLWRDFFKLPVDQMPYDLHDAVKTFRTAYFNEKTEWFIIYDLVEFIAIYLDKIKHNYNNTFMIKNMAFMKMCNEVFQNEMSGYRFVEGIITPITSPVEIDEIEKGILHKGLYSGASTHINQALSMLSNRKNPDFRNSIKESISAVESVCKVLTNNPSATLGEALKKMDENNVKLHPALKESFNKLYGYTSDEKGIRHALTSNENQLNFDDAKFMLVSCSAFCNYLIAKSE